MGCSELFSGCNGDFGGLSFLQMIRVCGIYNCGGYKSANLINLMHRYKKDEIAFIKKWVTPLTPDPVLSSASYLKTFVYM